MQALDDASVAAALPWPELIEAIERIVVDPDGFAPERTVHPIPVAGGDDALLLMKPGWVSGDIIGVKVVTHFPDNGVLGLPTVQSGFLLFDATNGSLIGLCEANELTARRTAAASAVAAKRLARPDARKLLVVGTGALSPMTAQAHAAVRDFASIEVWGRDPSKAASVVERLKGDGYAAAVCADLDSSVAQADVISCVTGSTNPLVKGALLRPGTHVDLIGGFTFAMRETDDDVARRASLFVDTRADGSLAGDLAQPLAAGIITADDIKAELIELIDGRHPGRQADDEITFFKSAGFAMEDLAAARLAFGRVST